MIGLEEKFLAPDGGGRRFPRRAGAQLILIAGYRGRRFACTPANVRQPSGFLVSRETKQL